MGGRFGGVHGWRWLLLASILGAIPRAIAVEDETPSDGVRISCLDERLVLAPYVWKPSGSGPEAQIEATMPGAYLRGTFQDASRIDLIVDGDVNAGCPASSMPVVEYSVDEKPYKVVPLTRTAGQYALPLAMDLDPKQRHRFEVFFRAGDLTNGRWAKSASRLSLVGFQLNEDAEAIKTPSRPKRAIGFGDSITEGVGGDGLFTSWQKLEVNNARATWLPIVAGALDAEYGQLGSGGQGMVRGLELPPLIETWKKYDAESSRLVDGKLSPQPDYVFCAMGTNDFEKVITDDYTRWLGDLREAAPAARVFCIIPPLQVHADEIAAAVQARRTVGDQRVYLVSTAALASEYRVNQGPTLAAFDGVHPSVYGQARLAALITAQAAGAKAGH